MVMSAYSVNYSNVYDVVILGSLMSTGLTSSRCWWKAHCFIWTYWFTFCICIRPSYDWGRKHSTSADTAHTLQ